MIDKIRRTCDHWKLSKLSMAAKTTLINSSLLSIPTFYLLVYPIPESVLLEINKIIRDFLWHKGGKGKGIHAVS